MIGELALYERLGPCYYSLSQFIDFIRSLFHIIPLVLGKNNKQLTSRILNFCVFDIFLDYYKFHQSHKILILEYWHGVYPLYLAHGDSNGKKMESVA